MKIIKKLFVNNPKDKQNAITIYLDADLKRSLQTKDQTAKEYMLDNNFEEDQFLYLLLRNKKTGEVVLKRRLNHFQRLSQSLALPNEELKAFLIVGYGSERSTIPKISTQMPRSDSMRFSRSGTLTKYNEHRNVFEECQLKLHHDYLTFYKFRETEKELSFIPLENSVVEIVNEKKYMFAVKDKFNQIIFKTSSKQDMYSWQLKKYLGTSIDNLGNRLITQVIDQQLRLLAITEAIKICNSEIYMNEMEERLTKSMKEKISHYVGRCTALKDPNRIITLDDMGRQALRSYFNKNTVPQLDAQLLQIIQQYLLMCKCRRERGQAQSEQMIAQIKQSLGSLEGKLPEGVELRDLSSKNQFVKTIEQIQKYLDGKYRKEIIDKKNMHEVLKNYLLEQYRQQRTLPLATLFGNHHNQPPQQEKQQPQQQKQQPQQEKQQPQQQKQQAQQQKQPLQEREEGVGQTKQQLYQQKKAVAQQQHIG